MRRTKRPLRVAGRSHRKPSIPLLDGLAVKGERFHGRYVVEGEEHALFVGAMPVQRPGGAREDVLLFPFEALACHLRPAAAFGYLVNHAARVTMRLGLFAAREELQLRA